MAMNKKEQQEMASLREELRVAKALRFTDTVNKDIPHPAYDAGLTLGWDFNAYSGAVKPCCSTSSYHGWGRTDKTDSQRGIAMFSTKLLALKGLRNALERKFAKELADVDEQIEAEKSVAPQT